MTTLHGSTALSAVPRRSVLYMPGANARALEKARTLSADSLILDLEDAVAPEAKTQARQQVVQALAVGGYGDREVIVRINGLDTAWAQDDIAALAAADVGNPGYLVPKISSVADLQRALIAFEAANCSLDGGFWIMAETPACILNIADIAAADQRLTGIVLGTSDLARDTRVRHTADRLGLITALNLCVYAARANGLAVIDGVHLQLDDDEGFRAACEQGRDLGFDGKSLIHPRQIEAANAVFAPDAAAVALAREIVAAWQDAQAQGKGVVVVNGALVENLHVEEAQQTLAMAELLAQRAQ